MQILTEKLIKNEYVDWMDWKVRELQSLCEFYVECGICQRKNLQTDQYKYFLAAVIDVEMRKKKMIAEIVNLSEGLKAYLQIHSVFNIERHDEEWFTQTMADILEVSDEDVKAAFRTDVVPQGLLDKLRDFDPEPIGIEIDPIKIEFDFWNRNGPIVVTDIDWENINGTTANVEEFLSQFDVINAGRQTGKFISDEDECPF